MIYVRGNNVYPSALEAIIRGFAEIAEFRLELDATGALPVLRIEVEPISAGAGPEVARRIDRAIQQQLLFRAEVSAVAPGSLPRYEVKARRFSRKV